ncbi:MAG: Cache 3/Cache 2 fusion domain-containing protein [Chlamydiales bacterium]|nr:Cache 3/Cache 2 fusion domain-containing protein [Chlamydiales bacterium]
MPKRPILTSKWSFERGLLLLLLTTASFTSLCAAATPPKPSDAKALGKELMSNLPGIFSLDQDNKERVGSYEVPALRNGNWVLRAQPIPLVDSFSEQTGAVTTLFVKVQDEFVRISTTEPGEKAGAALSHSHPAYKKMIGELRYTDKVTLAGKEYMADYDVFRDRQGRVIGAYLVAIPIEK